MSLDDLRFYNKLVRALDADDADVTQSKKKSEAPSPSCPDAQPPCMNPSVQMQQIADALSSLTANIADLVNTNTKLEQRMKDFESAKPTTKLYSEVTTAAGPLPPVSSSHLQPKKTSAFSGATPKIATVDPVFHPRGTRKQRNRRRGIAGCGESAEATTFHAADRDIFIYRVSSETTVDDIKQYLNKLKEKRQMNITVKDLKCVSHPDCVVKSFRLTVPCKEFESLMKGDVWPPSVRVRRFIRPKSQTRAA